jgi:hypothetical protein
MEFWKKTKKKKTMALGALVKTMKKKTESMEVLEKTRIVRRRPNQCIL